MSNGRGPGGMTAKTAICKVMRQQKRATGDRIFKEVKKIYQWKDNTIYRQIMGQTINLWPGYHEWDWISQEDKCLLLRADGYFEYYNQSKHGKFSDQAV